MTILLVNKEEVRAAFAQWGLHRIECTRCRDWEEYEDGTPCPRGLDLIELMGKALARCSTM